jgi:hypothetical protein
VSELIIYVCVSFYLPCSLPYVNILFTVDFYIINFVECKIFLSHKTEFSMVITLLLSQIYFPVLRSAEAFS